MRLPNIVINNHVIPIPVNSYTNDNKPANPILGDYYYQLDGITGLYKYTGLKWDHMGDSIQPADPYTIDYSNKKLIKSSFVGDLENMVGTVRYYPECNIQIEEMWITFGRPSPLPCSLKLYKNNTDLLADLYIPPNTRRTNNYTTKHILTPSDYLTTDIEASDGSDLLFTMVYYAIIPSQV